MVAVERAGLTTNQIQIAEQGVAAGAWTTQQVNTTGFLESQIPIIEVADHEIGHWTVGEYQGHTITQVTIKPEGQTLGSVTYSINSAHSLTQRIESLMVTAAAGEVAEEYNGVTDHSGCGSDRFKRRMLAEVLHFWYDQTESVDGILGRTMSQARSLYSAIPSSVRLARRWQLIKKQTIA